MDQIKDLDVYCRQLVEDGLLREAVSADGIRELEITDEGRCLVSPGERLVVPTTKQVIYTQLREKERSRLFLQEQIMDILRPGTAFLSTIQIKERLGRDIDIPELHSVLFHLLGARELWACGPLYGRAE